MEQKKEASQAVERRAEYEAFCAWVRETPGKPFSDMAWEAWQDGRARLRAALKDQPPVPFDRNTVLDEVAALFPQPYMEYFGNNIQESIATLKAQPAPTEAQDDGLSPVYAWLERSTRNSPAEVANAARTMMAFYQGAEFPEAEQGDPLDTKLPCDVVIGNMTIRKGVSLGVLVGKAQRDNTRLREFLPQPTPEQIAAFNAFLQNHITDAGEIVAAQGEDSARLDWKRITAPGQVKVGDKLRFTIGDEKFSERVKQIINPGYPDEELIYNKRRNFYVITSNAITNFGSSKNVEFLARASAETGGVKP